MTDTISAGADAQPGPGEAPQLVIFDLDGTLTDSAEGIVASFLHALSHVGAAVPEGDLAARIVGPPMDDTFRAMQLGESTDEAIAAFRAEYGARGWAMRSSRARARMARAKPRRRYWPTHWRSCSRCPNAC